MDKYAQSKRETGRGALNWIREKVNMPGAYLDSFFKPELDRVMTSLKSLDDKLRSELTGKKVGNAEPPATAIAAKDLLKSARTNFNRREYMSGIGDLGRFHKKMFDISQEIGKFFVDVNKIHNKFLFEGLSDKSHGHLKELQEHMNRKASVEMPEYFIKEAGIMDFFYNIGTRRGRALAAWEKKYPKQTKDLREWGLKLIDDGDTLLNETIGRMKEMATARATRRPDEYMDSANEIKNAFNKYDSGGKGFKAYYETVIMPFLKIKDEIEKEQATKQPPTPPTGPQSGKVELGAEPPSGPSTGGPSGAPPGGPVPPPGGGFMTVMPSGMGLKPVILPSKAPTAPTVPPAQSPPSAPPAVPQAPDTEPKIRVAPQVEEPKQKLRVAQHAKFLQSLESLGSEDPHILGSYISKYAKSIQETDPETAIQLFSIVKKLKG